LAWAAGFSQESGVSTITFIFIDIAESEDKNDGANLFEQKTAAYRRMCEDIVEIEGFRRRGLDRRGIDGHRLQVCSRTYPG
jgi:hypothetical protein